MIRCEHIERFASSVIRCTTNHAEVRLQQRAVPSLVMSLLLDYGSSMRRDGAEVIYIDKKSRRKLREAVGGDRNLAIIDRWLNSYVVRGDDGKVVTIARRTKRLRWP